MTPIVSPKSVSRRAFLGTAGAGALATTVALGADALALPRRGRRVRAERRRRRGRRSRASHQAGIVTPVQDRLLFASFDVVTDDRDDLVQRAEGVDRRVAAHGQRAS